MKKRVEGILGLRKRVSQARGTVNCLPCFETNKVICVASMIRFIGLTGRSKAGKMGRD